MEKSAKQTRNGDDLYEVWLNKLRGLDNQGGTNPQPYYGRQELQKADVLKYLKRIGIHQNQLDDLSCIHLTGTKGKGSTCAFTTKILQNCGYKTGLFSSPPLTEIRERIRINGLTLSRQVFAEYGLRALELLYEGEDEKDDTPVCRMPGYFQYLTVLAFYIFMQEKVDVAIIEVFIGGEYDKTNILRNTTAVGISSLGLDHTERLGNTMEKIAWRKSGLCKKGRPVFTVTQPAGPLKVLSRRAMDLGAFIYVCPPLTEYGFRGNPINLGLLGKHQYINATLAVQLARRWIEEKRPDTFQFHAPVPAEELPPVTIENGQMDETLTADGLTEGNVARAAPFVLPDEFIQALTDCYWPGRNQILKRNNVTYYFDTAHTRRSISCCSEWFKEESAKEASSLRGKITRILLFNLSTGRDGAAILPRVVDLGFDVAIFCPGRTIGDKQDEAVTRKIATLSSTAEVEVANSNKLKEIFKQISLKNGWNNQETITRVFPSITEALQWAVGSVERLPEAMTSQVPKPPDHLKLGDHVQVLVTGSTFIVGGAIKILEPDLALGQL